MSAQLDALRRYFLAHEAASAAITGAAFAEAMAAANKAAQELRVMGVN